MAAEVVPSTPIRTQRTNQEIKQETSETLSHDVFNPKHTPPLTELTWAKATDISAGHTEDGTAMLKLDVTRSKPTHAYDQ